LLAFSRDLEQMMIQAHRHASEDNLIRQLKKSCKHNDWYTLRFEGRTFSSSRDMIKQIDTFRDEVVIPKLENYDERDRQKANERYGRGDSNDRSQRGERPYGARTNNAQVYSKEVTRYDSRMRRGEVAMCTWEVKGQSPSVVNGNAKFAMCGHCGNAHESKDCPRKPTTESRSYEQRTPSERGRPRERDYAGRNNSRNNSRSSSRGSFIPPEIYNKIMALTKDSDEQKTAIDSYWIHNGRKVCAGCHTVGHNLMDKSCKEEDCDGRVRFVPREGALEIICNAWDNKTWKSKGQMKKEGFGSRERNNSKNGRR